MVVTGIADDMVECRWYDGQVVQREAFREDELVRGEGQHSQHIAAPAGAGAFNIDYVRTRSVDVVGFFDRTASK